MRYLKLSILLMLVLLTGCNSKGEHIEYINSGDELVFEESFKDSFSVSFWLNPKSAYYGSEILTISDSKQKVTLINNSETDGYMSTGISLVHDNGDIHKSSNNILETYNGNHIVVTYVDNTFFLYLNGEYIGDKSFGEAFDLSDITFKIGNKNFLADYSDINIQNKALTNDDIKKELLNNGSRRLDNIYYPDTFIENAKGKVALPYTYQDIKYTSDSPYLHIIDNKYLLFDKNDSTIDREINLKAELNILGEKVEKELTFISKGQNDQNKLTEISNIINNKLQYVISESNLFENKYLDADIKYEVIKGDAKYNDGHFIINSNNDKEDVTIKAKIKLGNDEKEIVKDLVLIDEYSAYLLVYFDGHDGWPDHITGEESIYLAISKDKINWTKLNDKPIVKANSGTNRFRDPYATRDKNGDFIITATEGYDNEGMYLIKTNDFIDFDTKHISFTGHDASINLEGKQTWAPEIIYNPIKDLYTILFSDPSSNNEAIYGVDTKDFNSYDFPYVYFRAGYNVIDANVTFIDNNYYLYYKDEELKTIHYALANNINNPTWQIYDDINANGDTPSEGPFVLNDHINNEYELYLDNYKESLIYSAKMYKWHETIDTYPTDNIGINNIGGVRHFSIIELTDNEYERIMDYYD